LVVFTLKTISLQLSIIIVNYNVKYYLENCLLSVIAACANVKAEIIVVDNASTDGSKAYLANRFNTVHFIWKTTNDGFSKANNEGLQIATGAVVLFLNPDTIVPEDCFEKCLAFINTDNRIGAVGVRMIDGIGNYLPESKRGFPGPFTSFCKLTGLTKLFPTSSIFATYYLGNLPNNATNTIDVIAGACMFVPKKVLDEVGAFDESFFMYGEDIDLSYRIKKAGYSNYIFADTTIIHFKGESTQKLNKKYVQHFYGAMQLFVAKHYSSGINIVFKGVLQLAIFAKAILSSITTVFKQQLEVDGQQFIAQNIGIVGNDAVYNNIAAYWKNKEYGITKATLHQTNSNIDTIVFSSSVASFTNIIAAMQHQHKYKNILLHAAGAQSIVGSNNKNSQGVSFLIVNK
jgi:GT2 family glycosyltransferase